MSDTLRENWVCFTLLTAIQTTPCCACVTTVLMFNTFLIAAFVNNTKGMHCYLFLATVVTRTRYNITSY